MLPPLVNGSRLSHLVGFQRSPLCGGHAARRPQRVEGPTPAAAARRRAVAARRAGSRVYPGAKRPARVDRRSLSLMRLRKGRYQQVTVGKRYAASVLSQIQSNSFDVCRGMRSNALLVVNLCKASGSSGLGAGSAAAAAAAAGVVGTALASGSSAAATSGAAPRCRFAVPSMASLQEQILG